MPTVLLLFALPSLFPLAYSASPYPDILFSKFPPLSAFSISLSNFPFFSVSFLPLTQNKTSWINLYCFFCLYLLFFSHPRLTLLREIIFPSLWPFPSLLCQLSSSLRRYYTLLILTLVSAYSKLPLSPNTHLSLSRHPPLRCTPFASLSFAYSLPPSLPGQHTIGLHPQDKFIDVNCAIISISQLLIQCFKAACGGPSRALLAH